MSGQDAKRGNARIGWTLASIAVAFFLGVIANYVFFRLP
ncbi:MAG: cytochrome oxidase small assembly protein [Burkholderiales bacterium]|jgi:hypothetical protein